MAISELSELNLPSFSKIIPEQIEPTIKEIINENRDTLQKLLKSESGFTWETLLSPLEDLNDKLGKVWAPFSHMHAVVETDALRDAYKACIPILTAYSTELMQNEDLFRAIKSLAEGTNYQKLDSAQKKVIENELRDFKLAGVNLSSEDKNRYKELQQKLSELSTQFAENILDATQGWTLHVVDPAELKGLPEETLALAAQVAKEKEKEGWIFGLDQPTYISVMKYLDNRELRKQMYEAFSTRASDQGPQAGKWDNTPIMDEILEARHARAKVLGFKNYAENSLATKMAKSPEQVLEFLNNLVSKSKQFGEKDKAELFKFASETAGLDQLEAWDLAFYTEKLRQAKYDLSQEDLKPYFPANKVLEGMFAVVKQLYGLDITERNDVDVWHPQVQFFEIHDALGKLRGGFYTDLYARPHKREGAWMDDCRGRRKLADGTIQYPVAFLTCNFTPPVGNKPALLTHDEVTTLFHEFGHCLHHLMTQVDYAGVAGLNGVAWDAVEFPSQFFEFWCWDKDALKLISGHYETGESLPDSLYNKLIAAKNFQSGLHMLRQLEFALFDFRIHLEYDPNKPSQIQTILNQVRKEVSVFKTPAFNRFQNSFSHIFAGGYAAGYYSYKWAEVLASDAFSRFEEEGVLNPDTGRAFLQTILEKGGTKEPMELFIEFRGREPQIEPLLRHSGFTI